MFYYSVITKNIAKTIAQVSLICLSSCSSSSSVTTNPSPTATITSVTSPTHQIPAKYILVKNAGVNATVMVTIYKVDSQCEKFIPEQVSLPKERAMDIAVGQVIQQQNTGDFNLEGYRISVEPKTAIATVDFRLSGSSQRRLSSLSSCEQMALFGSLNKTLTGNSLWHIKKVRFTEQGKTILL